MTTAGSDELHAADAPMSDGATLPEAVVRLSLNGQACALRVDADELLLDTIRERCGLTGTHQGCDTAQCGVCTVLVDGVAIKSCNRLTLQTDGCEVLTIEGLAGESDRLHPIQQAFSRNHALQCGFCTPGFVMRALAMVDEATPAEPGAIRRALSGNLCRCTGYDGIVAALCEVLPRLRAARAEPMQWPERIAGDAVRSVDLRETFEPGHAYCRPQSLDQASEWLADNPQARALAGGQSLLPAIQLGLAAPTRLIDLQAIGDLRTLRSDAGRLLIGAMATHARVAADPLVRSRWPMLAALAGGIADPQVRAAGTIGGSLANNDPAACWPAAVLASAATVITTRRRIGADDFFTGLFGTALQPAEVITGIEFPPFIGGGYLKFEQPASRFALVGVAVIRLAGSRVGVAITGLGSGVIRWSEAEDRLGERFDARALAGLQLDPGLGSTDLHASGEYRAHLAGVLLRRVVGSIIGRAFGRPGSTLCSTMLPVGCYGIGFRSPPIG